MVEDDDMVITESGAITEYLIETYGHGKLAPARGTKAYVEYSQWLHFAESSAILPLLLKLFVEKDGCETNFLAGYADVEIAKVMGYFDLSLSGKTYLVGDSLTGADIMMSFIVEALQGRNALSHYPNIAQYAALLSSHAAYKKANELEIEYA